MSDHSPTPAPQPTVGPTSMGDVIQGVRREIRAAPQEGTTPPFVPVLEAFEDAAVRYGMASAMRVDDKFAPASARSSTETLGEAEVALDAARAGARASLAAITLSQTDSSLRATEPTIALSEAVDAVNWAKSMMAHDGGETSTTADLASAMDGLDRLYLAYERLLKSFPAASSPTVTPPQTPTLGGQAAMQRELKAWRWLHWGTAASWACPCGHAHGRAIQICEDCQTPRPAMAIPLDYGFAVARSTPTEEKTNG